MEFLKTLLSGAVGAGIVAGLFSLLGKRVDNRHEERKEKMDETKHLRGDVADLQKSVSELRKQINGLQENDKAVMKAVSALLLHNMTGNATGKMQQAHEELTNYIINHGGEN